MRLWASIWSSLASVSYTHLLNAHMKDGSCLCALMENEEGIVGKAMPCIYTVMPDEINMSGKCAALFSVYTLPKYRGRGYMKELLDYLLEKAKEAGVSEVFASAEKKAIPLYQRIGFTFQENEMSIRLWGKKAVPRWIAIPAGAADGWEKCRRPILSGGGVVKIGINWRGAFWERGWRSCFSSVSKMLLLLILRKQVIQNNRYGIDIFANVLLMKLP